MSDRRSVSRLPEEPGGATRLDAVLDAVDRARAGRPASEVPVLEVGCGNGNLAIPIAAAGYPVTGLEPDAQSVEEARARCPVATAKFVVGLPLAFTPEVPPQIIVLSEVLEHVHDPQNLLSHLSKIAAPGARLVLTVPNGYGPWELMNFAKKGFAAVGLGKPLRTLQRALGYTGQSLQSHNPHLEHVQFFRPGPLTRLVEASGWRVLARRNLSMFVAVFPFSMVFRRWHGLERWDSWLSDYAPEAGASGWLWELESVRP